MVSFPGQSVRYNLKAFKLDELKIADVKTTIASYAQLLGKTAKLLDGFNVEPPNSYVQGNDIQITIQNANIKKGDTVYLNVYNEFSKPPTQEYYSAVATEDGMATFKVKHIGLMSLFKLEDVM